MGQEQSLVPGTQFAFRSYQVPRPDWDHDHCSMCFAKFSEPIGAGTVHEGYATTADFPRGEAYEWICAACFDDFSDEFGWVVIA